MVTRWNKAQLTGKRLHWLLDLVFAGRVVRLSHEDITVTSSESGDLQYAGVLASFNVPLSLDLFSDAASLITVKVAGVLPVNVPLLIAEGHDLGAATGELCQWIEGTDYEDRRVIFRGRVRDPEYAGSDEPVNFALEDSVADDNGMVPEPSAAVTYDTWGGTEINPGGGVYAYLTLAESEKGLPYPVVFGYAGRVSINVAPTNWIPASPGVWAGHNHIPVAGPPAYVEGYILVIAGHRVTAGFVYLSNTQFTAGSRFEVRHMVDDLGRQVAVVYWQLLDGTYTNTDAVGDYYALGAATIDSTFQPYSGDVGLIELFVSWYDPINADGGGMQGADGRTVRGAGDVLEAVLNFSTMTIDRARIGATKGLLNRFKIDATIEAGVKPWDWIRANLLPILPVSVVKGPDGVYFVVWRYDATAADAVGHIDADADPAVEVSETIRYDTARIRNSFRLKYALSLSTGVYQGAATLGATYDAATPTAGVSLHCAQSQRRYRVRGEPPASGVFVDEIESFVIYDDDTANAVLAWRAMAFCFARRTIELLVPEAAWAWLERGNVVLLSVSWLYLSRQVCLVESIEASDDGMIGLRLLLLEDPPRDSRTP